MTRIIAGSAKGRPLKVPQKGTRPTSDRVRESVFASVGHYLGSWQDTRILDLYAGTGALALESLSRGAEVAVAVDASPEAVKVILANADLCKLNLEVYRSQVQTWLSRAEADVFDVVFLDPPYDLDVGEIERDISMLVKKKLIAEGSLVVVEQSARAPHISLPAELRVYDERNHGETRVTMVVW